MKILITGGCGFLGSNLAATGIHRNFEVTIFDNLSRTGADVNLSWLRSIGSFNFIHSDIRNKNVLEKTLAEEHFDFIFHLAGQVAMTSSIRDPFQDFEINAIGTMNILEAIRNFSPHSHIFYSSTNKVYGDLEQYNYTEAPYRYNCVEQPDGFNETVALDFHSPYGCSKGCADQYVLDYHRIFDIKSTVFRHSSMYGGRQFATYDQGWIGWFCKKATELKCANLQEPISISGNGKQVRDILFCDDIVDLYFSAIEKCNDVNGEVFNIGGGIENSLSLLELFSILEKMLEIKIPFFELPPRQSDQKVFVADIAKIKNKIGWKPETNLTKGLSSMLSWINSR